MPRRRRKFAKSQRCRYHIAASDSHRHRTHQRRSTLLHRRHSLQMRDILKAKETDLLQLTNVRAQRIATLKANTDADTLELAKVYR